MFTKWQPPNTEEAKRPQIELDKSGLSINELNRGSHTKSRSWVAEGWSDAHIFYPRVGDQGEPRDRVPG